jgi:hypothetical protein
VLSTIDKDDGSFTDLLKESNAAAEAFTDKFFTVQQEKLALERDKLRQDQRAETEKKNSHLTVRRQTTKTRIT